MNLLTHRSSAKMPATPKQKSAKLPKGLKEQFENPSKRRNAFYTKAVKYRMQPEVEDKEMAIVGIPKDTDRRSTFWLSGDVKIKVAGYNGRVADRVMAQLKEWATFRINQLPNQEKLVMDDEMLGAMEHALHYIGYTPDQV